VGRGCRWWIGDWLRYGNARYGEKYKTAASITGYDAHSLMNMAYVASRVDPSRRRENLSFSHHAELAALPSEEQERWLGRIETDRLSVRALRCALRDPESAEPPTAGTQVAQLASEAKDAPSEPRAQRESTKAAAAGTVCPNCGYRLARRNDGRDADR
jgi:hypothetical protein